MFLDGKSPQEYAVNTWVLQRFILDRTLLTFPMVLFVILLSILTTLLSTLSVSGIWSVATTRDGCRTWIWYTRRCELLREAACWFESMLEKLNLFRLIGLLTLLLLMWKWMDVSLRKNQKMVGLTFSSKLDRGSYIISIAKTDSKKIGAFIHSMKSFSPEAVLYLFKSTIRPCME